METNTKIVAKPHDVISGLVCSVLVIILGVFFFIVKIWKDRHTVFFPQNIDF